MPNYLQFTTPSGENVTFTLTAAVDGQDPAFEAQFTTASGDTVYLKVFETGDSANPITDYSTMEQGKLYDVEAYTEPGGDPVDISVWTGEGIEFVGFTFAIDRRPIFQSSYSGQKDSVTDLANNSVKFGCNTQNYRKTGATGNNTTSATNGRIAWIDNSVAHAATAGFERYHLTNIAGHTSLTQGNQQPHYTSGAYQCLNLDAAKYFVYKDGQVASSAFLPSAVSASADWYLTLDDNHLHYSDGSTWTDVGEAGAGASATNRPYILADSPFTDTGLPSGTLGDAKDAWKEAISYLRGLGATEISSYQGYRAVFTDKLGNWVPFDHATEKVISLSKESSNDIEPSWQGQAAGDPAFSPFPGYDGEDYTVWTERMAPYFDKEIAGIHNLGFDGIGLDTGTYVWDASAGRGMGAYATGPTRDGVGNSGLVDFFNGFGLKPAFEAVGMDTWTYGTNNNAFPAAAERYQASCYWAFAGTWWGYNDTGAGGTIDRNGSGGHVFWDGANTTIGDSASAAKFDKDNSEVHAIFQWTYGLGGQDASSQSSAFVGWVLENHGWLKLKQIMWDFHDAGIIVGANGGSSDFTAASGTPNAGETFSSADFYAYAISLYNDPTQARPEPPAEPAQTLTWTGNGSGGVTGAPVMTGTVSVLSEFHTNILLNGTIFRLINGSELSTNPAYSSLYSSASGVGGSNERYFANTGNDTDTYLNNYRFRIRKDAGAWTEMDIPLVSGQSFYNNGTSSQSSWPSFNIGNDTSAYQIEVYLRADLDNDQFPD